MKRRDLIRHIEDHGCYLDREGTNHTIYRNPVNGHCAPVPRHREIMEPPARTICDHVSETSWRRLFEHWRRDETPQRRLLACRLAARFEPSAVAEDLKVLLEDADGHVRKAATRLLRGGILHDPAFRKE